MDGNIVRDGGKDSAESQVGQEFKDLASEVKDKASQLTVEVIVGRWFLSIEVAECNIGAKERDGVLDGRGVSDDNSRCQDIGEGGDFEE